MLWIWLPLLFMRWVWLYSVTPKEMSCRNRCNGIGVRGSSQSMYGLGMKYCTTCEMFIFREAQVLLLWQIAKVQAKQEAPGLPV
jgi:hypothetical protein